MDATQKHADGSLPEVRGQKEDTWSSLYRFFQSSAMETHKLTTKIMAKMPKSPATGQVGIGFLPDREKSNSLSRAGSNVLSGRAGRTGRRRGLCARAAGSSSAARCAFPRGSYEECGGTVRSAAADGAAGGLRRAIEKDGWHLRPAVGTQVRTPQHYKPGAVLCTLKLKDKFELFVQDSLDP